MFTYYNNTNILNTVWSCVKDKVPIMQGEDMHNLTTGYLIPASALFRDSKSKDFMYSGFSMVILLGAFSCKNERGIVYIFTFIPVVFLPLGAASFSSCFFFLFPSGLRSQVRFARCPAAICSSRAVDSVTGTVHDKTV